MVVSDGLVGASQSVGVMVPEVGALPKAVHSEFGDVMFSGRDLTVTACPVFNGVD